MEAKAKVAKVTEGGGGFYYGPQKAWFSAREHAWVFAADGFLDGAERSCKWNSPCLSSPVGCVPLRSCVPPGSVEWRNGFSMGRRHDSVGRRHVPP